MPDIIYSLTRRKGRRGTIVEVGDSNLDLETGERSLETTVTNIRLMVKEPTSYGRLFKANATQQDVGDTTFILWTGDTSLRRLDAEDYLIMDETKYQVVTCTVEETALVITAKEVRGAVGKQAVTVNVSNSLGVAGSADGVVS